MADREPTEEQLAEAFRRHLSEPRAEFVSKLRDELSWLDACSRRPKALWPLIVAYLLSGFVLLLIAALGA